MELGERDRTAGSFYWRRCKSVTFEGDQATWELESKRYDVIRAYQKAPHRQLLQADTDALLRAFLRSWGPLTGSFGTDLDFLTEECRGTGSLRAFRHERNQLNWTVKLFSSIEDADVAGQRILLMQFRSLWEERRALELADEAKWPIEFRMCFPSTPRPAIPLHVAGVPSAAITDAWIATAKWDDIEMLCHRLLYLANPGVDLGYVVDREKGGFAVKAMPRFQDLMAALRWMVWQDMFQGHPLRFCAECPKLIANSSRHEKKYCSPICARRKTAREWQRRKREKERVSDGNQKAR